jgi:Glycosyltransferase family 10 (fucosyltransferase) C-term
MKIIKLTVGPWPLTQMDFNYYTELNNGLVGSYRFEVNNDCDKCDYWIVRGDLQKKSETVYCNKTIFLLDEVHEKRDLLPRFIAQFDGFIGVKPPPVGIPYIFSNEIVPWLFLNKTYDEVSSDIDQALKTKELCIMSSNANFIPGHRTRYAFTNQLIGHFKDRVQTYGRGFAPFDCKFDILKNYKYCIAIENCSMEDYFTEKLNECYLCESFPIYYGCPNLEKYYDERSFAKIDTNDLAASIRTIEELLETNAYGKKLDYIKMMKKRYFESYHFPHALVRLLEKNAPLNGQNSKKHIFQENYFTAPNKGFNQISEGVSIITKGFFARARNKFDRML